MRNEICEQLNVQTDDGRYVKCPEYERLLNTSLHCAAFLTF